MYKGLIFLAVLLLSGCASTPSALKGEFADVTPRGIQGGGGSPAAHAVRWGGSIVNTVPEKGQTCFTIVARPLDRTGRPRAGDKTLGRFIACAQGFYEPEVYAPHREVTVVGRLAGVETREVGGYSYHYPKVAADTVYLWEKKSRVSYPVYQFYPSPYYMGYPYYYPYGGHYNGLLFEPNAGPFPFFRSPMYFRRLPHQRRREAAPAR